MKFIKAIDVLGQPFYLNYESSNSKKTYIGGFLTIGVCIFSIYCINYFGMEIFEKKKPITKFTKQYVNESVTYLTDFPIVFWVTKIDLYDDKMIDIDKYITFFGRYYEGKKDEDTNSTDISMHQVFVERCNQAYFDALSDSFSKGIPNGEELYCLNPRKIKYSNGTIDENRTNLNFKNDLTTLPSTIVRIDIYECDPIRDKKECHPLEKRRKMINEFYIVTYLLDYYIDSSDLEEPDKAYLYSVPQPLALGITKETTFKVKTSKIITDSGILMEETSEKQINQIENYFKDTQIGGDKIFILAFGNTRIQDFNYRKYLKIQDLLAQIGGLIKSMLLIGSLACNYYSNQSFAITLSNLIFFKYESPESNMKVQNIGIAPRNTSNIHLKFNIIRNTQTGFENKANRCAEQNNTCLKTSFYDFILGRINKKSKYDKKLYDNIRHFVDYQFDVFYIIKQFIKIHRLEEMFNKNNQFNECLKQKLNYDLYNFESMSEKLDDSEEHIQRFLKFQEKLTSLINS